MGSVCISRYSDTWREMAMDASRLNPVSSTWVEGRLVDQIFRAVAPFFFKAGLSRFAVTSVPVFQDSPYFIPRPFLFSVPAQSRPIVWNDIARCVPVTGVDAFTDIDQLTNV